MAGSMTRALILISMVACLTSIAHAIAGQATFYTEYTPSACYGNEDQGNMIAAVDSGLFANRGGCGTRYRVTCTGSSLCKGGSVDVIVVDLCAGCPANQFDLSEEAFSVIADILLLILMPEELKSIIHRYENGNWIWRSNKLSRMRFK